MPRRGRVVKRKISPDSKYNSVLVQKFINRIMMMGKKSKAEGIVYKAMDIISKKGSKSPLEVFEQAIRNATPLMEVKARRVGGSTYQIPIEVERERGTAIAMKWLKEGAMARQGRSMQEKLSAELFDAFSNTGGALKKKEDLHKTADANKAFAHFRW
ncbi:MAG: 30S ribosomal protein S7 [Candidatus Saganbacteria bacterium]|nr:30S ribosomal protein S7 [Candidatus Saganbacteria bacterium]